MINFKKWPTHRGITTSPRNKINGIGFITPPLGLNLFIVSGVSGTPVLSISRHAIYLVFSMLAIVFLMMTMPAMAPASSGVRFEVAGSLMELSLPCDSAAAYAKEMAQ